MQKTQTPFQNTIIVHFGDRGLTLFGDVSKKFGIVFSNIIRSLGSVSKNMIFVDHLKSPASGFQEIHYKYNTFLIMMKECLLYVFVSLFVSVFGRIMQQRRRSMNWRLELTRLSGKIGLGSSHSVAPGSAHPNHPNHREILLTSIISLVETPIIGKSFGRCQQIKLLL